VLVVASMAAIGHAPGMASYCASKAGVEAFCNSLRAEVRHLGVDVGVAYFSWIRTDLVTASDDHPVFGGIRKRIGGPMGRTYPVSMAAEAIVRGIERRARGVFTPRWIRFLLPIRGLLQPIAERGAAAQVAEIDTKASADVERRGARAASAPVGPGGAAAMEAADERRVSGA
jgi:short-subunit dehydrogenase